MMIYEGELICYEKGPCTIFIDLFSEEGPQYWQEVSVRINEILRDRNQEILET